MKSNRHEKPTRETHATSVHKALSSPMRLEIVGLFVEPGPLSIAEMAIRLGRPATSLYHHVELLEDAGVLQRAGTRPKGKRFETLFEPTETRMELEVDSEDEDAIRQAGQAMSAALRMAERDFMAALDRDDISTEGEDRNLVGMRMHVCLSPDALAQLNDRMQAIEDLLRKHAVETGKPEPQDQFISLTLLLAPLRGRRIADDSSSTSDHGEPS